MKKLQQLFQKIFRRQPKTTTSRRTVILTSNGNPLVSIAAQNVSDSSGAITIEVDTLETPTTLGTGDVQLRDNSSVLEYTNNAGSNWYVVGNDADAIHDDESAEISAITEKASPIGADLILIEDSEASNAKKRVQITNLPDGTDSDAIHDNVAAEINAVTEKASPIGADLILIEDSEASNAKKRVQITNLPTGSDSDAIHDNVSAEISAVTEKASPVGADVLLIEDSEASNVKKKVQITNLPGGADSDAIHDNVTGEIAAVTEKASPVGADVLLIEDSAASNAKKRVQITNLPTGSDSDAIHDNVAAEINAVTEKATPISADLILIEDSADSNAKKKVQLGNIPHTDSDAIHDNVTGEITAVTEKASPVGADVLLIEDSEASNAKKRVQITNLPGGADSDAIHDNIAAEISTVTEKASPVGADLILIEDSEASNAKKRVQITNLPGGADSDAIHDNVAAEINAVTEKASPVGADLILIEDSAASNAKKKVQISNLPTGSDSDAIHDNVTAEISAITEKTIPVAADLLLIEDSAASNAKKKVQIGNLPFSGDAVATVPITYSEVDPALPDASTAELYVIGPVSATEDSKTVFLMHSNTTNGSTTFTDESANSHVPVVASGSVTHSTTQQKFGTTALSFSSSKLRVPSHTDFALGTGAFTIDCWMYIEDGAYGIYEINEGNQPTGHVAFISADTFYFRCLGQENASISATPYYDTWTHIAGVRSGGDMKIYLNGTLAATLTVGSGASIGQGNLMIGGYSGPNTMLGYIDEFRLVKGEAKWTANFTPPTSPYSFGDTTKDVRFQYADGTKQSLFVDTLHNNIAAEISTITEKASPVGADLLLIEDSAASNAKKKVQISNLPAGSDSDAIHDNVTAEISAITEKTIPVAADLLLIEDSAASNAKKKIQIDSLPALVYKDEWNASTNIPALHEDQDEVFLNTLASGNGGDYYGTSYRQYLPTALLTSFSGDTIRVAFAAATGQSLNITQAYVGVSDYPTGDEEDFDGNQVQLTFDGGNPTVTVAANTIKYSDWISLTVDSSSDNILVAFDASNTLLNQFQYSTQAGIGFYKDTGATNESNITDVSGYSNTSNRIYGVYAVDLKTAGASVSTGDLYKVSVAGIQDLSGITNWAVGDLAVYDQTDGWYKINNAPQSEIQITKTGTTYSPTATECENLTVFCKTGSNTIQLTNPATGRPGNVRIYALDTNTVTVTSSSTNIRVGASTGNNYENNDTAYEWVWFLFDHAADEWVRFQENGTWSLTTT